MILSNDCWLKDNCKKFKNNNCQENSFCIKLFKLNELYNNALITEFQRKKQSLWCDSDGTDEDKFSKLLEIEKNIEYNVDEGKNYYIHSTICGNGKTSWALRLLQSYFNKIWWKTDVQCKALFINVPRFLLALKDNISEKNDYVEHIKKNIMNANLVIWDDIGTKAITSFEAEHLLSMIDTRMSNNKSNIFTSNMNDTELYELLGQRLASRVINFSESITLNGKDKRSLKFGGNR